jgi:hypothetical protein
MRPPTAAVPALIAALLLASCGGPEPRDLVTAAAIERHTRILGDDSMGGRGTGQPGYQMAADYVAARFREYGLEPGGPDGGFFQPVPLREYRVARAAVALVRGARVTPLAPEEDVIALPDPRDTLVTLEAPVVFVGHGVVAPAFGIDDYAGVDVAGRVVAVLWGAPPSLPPNPRAHYGGAEKARTAAARGAVGMIHLMTPGTEAVTPWAFLRRIRRRPAMTWLEAPGQVAAEVPRLPAVQVHPRVAAALFAGAPLDLAEADARAREGRGRALPLPVSLRLEVASRHRDLEAPNVLGLVPGADPALAAEHVVLTAHLDHDGIGEPIDGDSVYNGVFDNATAVAALLEVARAAAAGPRPARTLLFLATAAEEKGLLGATYFAARPTVPIGQVVANLNMDGNLLLFRPRSIVALGSEHSSLGEVAARAAAAEGLELETELMPEQAFFVRSDQYPFVRRGVPALFFVSGTRGADTTVDGAATLGRWLQTVYHTPRDDLGQPLDWEAGAVYARVVLGAARAVAGAAERPRWLPGDFFGETFGAAAAP